MAILRTTDGQQRLPRYFAQVFRVSGTLRNGRLDFVRGRSRRFTSSTTTSSPG